MRFAYELRPTIDENWHLARQMGIDAAVSIGPPRSDLPLSDYMTLARLKKQYEDFGFDLMVIEGWVPMDNIKRGTPEGEAELEQVCQIVRNMGALGIGVLCYSWMAHFTWLRTSMTERGRGGALVSSYDHRLTENAPESQGPLRITEEKLWQTLEHFLKRVVPVAEKAGVKLAIHPDDPPLSPVLGVGRIMRSVEAFERCAALVPSEANGFTFCQANFVAMGAPMPETIHRLGKDGLIHFVHFRDIKGDARHIVETFHDEGQTDMLACMKAYRDIGFKGPMRCDHAPNMYGDPNDHPGYEARGRLFALGYMKGLLQGVDAMRAAGHA
jgi:mannonate dehydratase